MFYVLKSRDGDVEKGAQVWLVGPFEKKAEADSWGSEEEGVERRTLWFNMDNGSEYRLALRTPDANKA